jgi:ATP-dependent Clp protease ATP-binding subunit ClpC
VLGEARLTDGRGRTTYFHNAIIVLTSNLGTRGAKSRLGLAPDAARAGDDDRRYTGAVLAAFRPELVNRLDQIVVFHPLAPDEIARVAEIATARLADRRGLTQAGVLLDLSAPALARLAEGGFSAELGARALRRHLDEQLVLPAARLLAAAGADAHGGTLTVRAPDEEDPGKAPGARLGEHAGEVKVALWRRGTQTGRRLVKGALALAALRRETDRELALPAARAVRDTIGQLEATLATARRPAAGRQALAGEQIARLSTQHAHLTARWTACTAAQGELHAAEELCLEALARDVDAVDLIDAAVLHRHAFRRELFWLLVALRPHAPGATLLVHTPDARAAVSAWVTLVLGAAAHHGWRASVHLPGEQAPGWSIEPAHRSAMLRGPAEPGLAGAWGPPHDRAWAEDRLASIAPSAALVRIAGSGANLLFGLETGLHRFAGLAGEPCHVWVDALEPRAEIGRDEWAKLPGPPSPRAARGAPLREITLPAGRVAVLGDELDVPWAELPRRLAEAAVVRVLDAIAEDRADALWRWEHPLVAAAERDARERG